MTTLNNKRYSSEAELVNETVNFLREEGYEVLCEIPNMGQSVDIVGHKGRYIICVEAKLRDWKKALLQCLAHEQVADYISIAYAGKKIPAGLYEVARRKGYGLIHRSESGGLSWATKARINKDYWKPQRTTFRNYIRRFSHESD